MHSFTLQANFINTWWLVFGCISASCNSRSYQPPCPRKRIVVVWGRSDRLSDLIQNQKFKGSSTTPILKKGKWTRSSSPPTPPPATISSLLHQYIYIFSSSSLFPNSLEEGNVVKYLYLAHTWLDCTLPDYLSLLNIWLDYVCMNCTNMIGSLSIYDDVFLYMPENGFSHFCYLLSSCSFSLIPTPLITISKIVVWFYGEGIQRPMFVKHEDGLGFISPRPLWLIIIVYDQP